MTRLADVTERYVADFRAFASNGAAGAPAWLREIREAAIARFAELGFPSMKQEEWRFTNTAPIAETAFALSHRRADGITPVQLTALCGTGARSACVVFVDGVFAPELSTVRVPPGGDPAQWTTRERIRRPRRRRRPNGRRSHRVR